MRSSEAERSKDAKTPAGSGKAAAAERAPRSKSVFREYAEALIVALALALFIRTFFVQAFKIPSESMLPTLQVGDHLLVNKFLYGVRNPINGDRYLDYFEPERGDIIVFVFPKEPEKDFIKRVVGIPGDELEMRNKELYRNGERVDPTTEPYAQHTDEKVRPDERDNWGPRVVPEGKVFVMGDNRDKSYDSRFWGFVPYENIKGKAFVIYWSWGDDSWIRWWRLGNLVH